MRDRFQHLVDAHYDSLWSYAHFLTGGATESEDLLHQAFLVAHEHIVSGNTFKVDAGKWMRGVLRNLVGTWWRQKRKVPRQLAEQLVALPQSDSAEVAARRDRMKSALDDCLTKLPSSDRKLVSKHYRQRLPIVALAKALACNVATLRVRLFRIRQALKACVEAVVSLGGSP